MPELTPLLVALLGGVCAGVATTVSALLVYRRAGQTLAVARDDSDAKRFQAITEAQDRLLDSLQQRVEELSRENVLQREQLRTLNETLPALREEHKTCLREQERLKWRVDELERVVASYRERAGGL